MAGKGAKKRSTLRKARMKQALKKAEKRHEQLIATLPKISEEDLLSFQFTHFGDDSRPTKWFVGQEEALNYDPEDDVDDGLGFYEDGVKRTLTDEQIAIFRRTELWHMQRDQQRDREAEMDDMEDAEEFDERARSPASDVSSLEDELLAFATGNPQALDLQQKQRQPSQNSRNDTADSSDSMNRRQRLEQQIPYEQRNKRKWESYIEEVDPEEGSLTHRRIARELDNQNNEVVELDY